MDNFKNQDFIDSANDELARRMGVFKSFTEAVSPAMSSHKGLSFYLDRRNRAKIAIEQQAYEVNASEIFADLPDNTVQGNPDLLSDEDETMWPDTVSYSERQIKAASQILKGLPDILSHIELEVWNLKQQGLGVVEIADVRNVSPAAISKTLTRCLEKIKKAYGKIRTEDFGGNLDTL